MDPRSHGQAGLSSMSLGFPSALVGFLLQVSLYVSLGPLGPFVLFPSFMGCIVSSLCFVLLLTPLGQLHKYQTLALTLLLDTSAQYLVTTQAFPKDTK